MICSQMSLTVPQTKQVTHATLDPVIPICVLIHCTCVIANNICTAPSPYD